MAAKSPAPVALHCCGGTNGVAAGGENDANLAPVVKLMVQKHGLGAERLHSGYLHYLPCAQRCAHMRFLYKS